MHTLLRLNTVISMTGLSRSTIYAYMANNRFPKSLKISDRCVAWYSEDIDTWIADRLLQRS